MVSKITIFEPHFEDVQFSPALTEALDDDGEDSEPHEEVDSEIDTETGRSRVGRIIGLGIVGAGLLLVGVAVRRLRSDDAEAIDIDATAAEETRTEAHPE